MDGNTDADEKLYDLLESMGDEIIDGVVAQDQKQFDQLWFLRKESVNAGVSFGLVSQIFFLTHFNRYLISISLQVS